MKKSLMIFLIIITINSIAYSIDNLGKVGDCFLNAGECKQSRIVGNFALVGSDYGLLVFDISDSSSPVLVNTLKTPDTVLSFDIFESYVYMACKTSGIIIANISDITNPIYVNTLTLQTPMNNARYVEIQDNYIFICAGAGSYSCYLYIADLTSAENPEIITYYNETYIRSFTVKDNYIYALYNGLLIIDISDIYSPTLVNTYSCLGGKIKVDDEKAYILSEDLTILDVSDINNIYSIGSCDISGSSPNLVLDDQYAYIIDSNDSGLTIVDISNSANPFIVNENPYYGNYITKYENNLLISRYHSGFFEKDGIDIIDVSDLNNVHSIGEFTTGIADKLIVKKNYAYVANGFSGLTVIDISNSNYPEKVSTISTGFNARDLLIDDEILFLSCYGLFVDTSLQIFDISNPVQPEIINSINFYYREKLSVAKYNNYLYCGGDMGGVNIYDISDLSNPHLVSQLDVLDYSYDLKIFEGILYVSGYWGGLQIYDLSDPEYPSEISYYPLGLALSIEVTNNMAFIGPGLQIFDTSNLSNPVLAETFPNIGDRDMFYTGDSLFVASQSGLHVFDIPDPYFAQETIEIDDININGVYCSKNKIYCTDEFTFMVYADTTITNSFNDNIPTHNFELQNYPNPFNPQTTIKFSIQNNSHINLLIYNIKGQKIKTLVNNEFIKGDHSVIWNGDDEYGNSVSSGVYLYKLNVDGKDEAVNKCLLLK